MIVNDDGCQWWIEKDETIEQIQKEIKEKQEFNASRSETIRQKKEEVEVSRKMVDDREKRLVSQSTNPIESL